MNATALLILSIALLAMLGLMLRTWYERATLDRDAQDLRGLRVLAALVVVLVVLCLAGCAGAPPKIPEQVTVVVERYKPLPTWATAPLAKPQPADATVGAGLRSHEARGVVIDVANCDRRLLALLDAGQPVDPAECGHDGAAAEATP